MPTARFFLPKPFIEKESVILEGQESQHLSRVCKRRPRDVVELVNGLGELALAEVLVVEKQTTTLLIKKVERTPLTEPQYILACALPHVQKLDLIVEKGTELGCDIFWFFDGDKSEKKGVSPNQKLRLNTIATSALKQSGRVYLPKMAFFPNLQSVLEEKATFYFGDTSPKAPLFGSVFDVKKSLPFCFITGPESGFSNEETKWLQKKAMGVKLHTNILRAETAPLSAITLMHHFKSMS